MTARIAIAIVCALVVAGCGSSRKADEKEIRATVVGFLHGLANGNAKKACSLLTAEGRRRLFGSATSAECEATVRKLAGRHGIAATRTRNQLRAARVSIVVFKSDTRATAQAVLPTENAPTAPFRVVKVGDRWLIAGPPKGG